MNLKLYKNSFIFFIGTIVTGAGAYLYQLIMGRFLSLSDFGALSALMNFFAIIGVPASALGIVTVRVVAVFKAQGKPGAIAYLINKFSWLLSLVGAVLFFIMMALSPWVINFLNLQQPWSYYLICSLLLIVLPITFGRGVMQGLQEFKSLSLNNISESSAKNILALILVWLGLGLSGAVGALVMASGLALILLLWQLKKFQKIQPETVSWHNFRGLFIFILIWTMALTALQSLDIILVKRFFSEQEAGLYAAVALLGKIILYTSAAICGAVFPMSTELFENGEHSIHRRLLWQALGLIFVISFVGTFFYWLMPNLIIKILFGGRYVSFAPYLWLLGLTSGLLSCVQLLATYFLSIKKRWFLLCLAAAPLVEIMLVYNYHQSIPQVIYSLIAVLTGLVAILFGFFLTHRHPSAASANSL